MPFHRTIFDSDGTDPPGGTIGSPRAIGMPGGRTPRGPLEGAGAAGRAAPFLAASALSLLASVVLAASDGSASLLAASAAFAAGVVLAFATPWERLPAWAQAVPPLAFLALAGIAYGTEGATAAAAPMLALPTMWFAIFGSRVELGLAALGAGLAVAVASPAAGDGGELGAASSWVAVLGLGGLAISSLIRQRESLLADVTALARTDPLTGLANRRAWHELLKREIARADRNHARFSVALVDLDRFKGFNDRFGHAAGDRLLKEAASRWSEQIRDMDLIARYGGEEFALLLPGAGFDDACAVVERVRSHTPAGITVSGGIAEWNGHEDPDAMLARADRALYEAKRGGRDRVHPSEEL